MNYRLIINLLIPLLLSIPSFGMTKQEVRYTYGGNFKANLYIPDISQPHYPVIIFGYDDFYENIGEKKAKEKGYDIDAFAKEFTDWGYITLIPIGQLQNPNAITGACHFLQNHPKIDKQNMHIIAANTHAVSALAAHSIPLPIKSLVVITPRDIDDTRFTSIPQIKRFLPNFKEKILVLGSNKESVWATQSQLRLITVLQSAHLDVTHKTYLYKKPWFWNPKNVFMQDIKSFIENKPLTSNSNQITAEVGAYESTYTHKPF